MMPAYPTTNLTYLTTSNVGSSFNAPQVAKEQQIGVFVQAVITGTAPTGTLAFQVSADGVNWGTLSGQTIAVSAIGTYNFNQANLFSRFWRLAWTFTSGSGSMAAMYNMN